MDIEMIRKATKKQLTRSRWEHTLRVVDTATQIAERYDVNLEKAEVAALLHDYCKFWSCERLITWIKKYQLPEDLLDYEHELWHAPVGAEVAFHMYDVKDSDILWAIRSHTSGRPGMSLLEKVIYLADYIEPGRQFNGLDEVRTLALIDLDRAVLLAMEKLIYHLSTKQNRVYPLTLQACEELRSKIKKEESV